MTHPVDTHVGARIKLRRSLIGVTQEKLADALDLSFQQVQKYEKGTNRVSASMLYSIASILGVSVSFFFEGLDQAEPRHDPVMDLVNKFITSHEGGLIVRLWDRVPKPMRAAVLKTVQAAAGENG
jgi:transcriptional regulator with XRE-family HTH domain